MMKYFDTFTGYGGFTLGIQRSFESSRKPLSQRTSSWNDIRPIGISSEFAGERKDGKEARGKRECVCIGFSEVNKYAIQVYEKHFPEHKNYGDITQINPAELPDFDLLTGGFPCQAFSIAGKRQGFNDTRGTLFFDIARILKEKRPRNFILENVKGLLSHDDGRTFKTIITTLTELGYCVEWQVLNAKDFGVPQNRERVFIVGHLGGIPERKVFPIGEGSGLSDKSDGQGKTSGGVASTISSNLKRGVHSGGETYAIERKIAHTVRTSGRASGIDSKQNWDSYLVEGRIRRLTPKECERLMGLPDDWTEGQSDTQRYKLCGNGVVVNVVEAVVRKLYNLPLTP